MAKTVSRFMILAKSDRMGKSVDDKGKVIPDEERRIRYSGILSFDSIDLSKVSKELNWGDFWTTKDIEVVPQTECFAVCDVMKDSIRITDIMTREEYLKSLGL